MKEFDSLFVICVMQMQKATTKHMLLFPNDKHYELEEGFGIISEIVECVTGNKHEYHVINADEALLDLRDCAKLLAESFPDWVSIPYPIKNANNFEDIGDQLFEWTTCWRLQVTPTCFVKPAIWLSINRIIVAATLALNKINISDNDIADIIEKSISTLKEYEGFVSDQKALENRYQIIFDLIISKSLTTDGLEKEKHARVS